MDLTTTCPLCDGDPECPQCIGSNEVPTPVAEALRLGSAIIPGWPPLDPLPGYEPPE